MTGLTPEDVRQGFRTVVQETYLDVASCAPLSEAVVNAVTSHLCDPGYGRDKQAARVAIEQTRALFARLIHADPDEIAFTKNVTEGLNCVANAIDWKTGDNIVLCPSLEHPNNRYLWQGLAARMGLELRLVPAPGHEYPVEDMISAIDHRTRLVTVSSVSYLPGFLTPLESLSCICRQKDILLLVDGAQSVGPLHTDVKAMGIDALAVSTQKGLLGVQGMGFLFVRSEWAQRLRPASIGRFGIDETASMGKGLVLEPLHMQRGARRFDLGNYNLLGVVAAWESLCLLTEITTPVIQAHTVALGKRLSAGLSALGLPVCKPRDQRHQAHVVSLGHVDPDFSDQDPHLLFRLHQNLDTNRVRASWRDGVLRFSMHFYNNDADIDRVLTLAQEFLATQART